MYLNIAEFLYNDLQLSSIQKTLQLPSLFFFLLHLNCYYNFWQLPRKVTSYLRSVRHHFLCQEVINC